MSRIVTRIVLSQKGIFYIFGNLRALTFKSSVVVKCILSVILFQSLIDLTWTDLKPEKEVFIFGIFKPYFIAPLVRLCCTLKGLIKSSNITGRLRILSLFRWSKKDKHIIVFKRFEQIIKYSWKTVDIVTI